MKIEANNIDMFWLRGESKINQFQQINFLERFYKSELSISERTKLIVKRIMLIEENEAYKISGKTGWSINNKINNGSFVGYIETTENFDMKLFPMIRKDVSYKAFKEMNII